MGPLQSRHQPEESCSRISGPRDEALSSPPELEDYLDRACTPLVGVVPYERRQEQRTEWREHLLSLAEAYQELGLEPAAAREEALRQFGVPERVGRALAREWRRTGGWDGTFQAYRCALAIFVPAGLAAGLLTGAVVRGPATPPAVLLVLAAVLLTPVAGGALVGLLSAGKRAVGTAGAISTLVLAQLAVLLAFQERGLPESAFGEVLSLLLVQHCLWLPAASLTAFLVGRFRVPILRGCLRRLAALARRAEIEDCPAAAPRGTIRA